MGGQSGSIIAGKNGGLGIGGISFNGSGSAGFGAGIGIDIANFGGMGGMGGDGGIGLGGSGFGGMADAGVMIQNALIFDSSSVRFVKPEISA